MSRTSRRVRGSPAFGALLACALMMGAAEAALEVRGIDVSAHRELEQSGVVWRDASGMPGSLIQMARSAGANTARFRVWTGPEAGPYSAATMSIEAARWKAAGFRILVDFHYSDTWADPGAQAVPAAWAGLEPAALRLAVRDHTSQTLAAFREVGAPADFVQLGNEITGGMLWNTGRVGGAFDTPQQWSQLAQLLGAARSGVVGGTAGAPMPKVLIHIDRGGDPAGTRWFFQNITREGVQFDVVALSYYPFWHGGLEQLETTINLVADEFGKDVLVVEVAYAWTLGWADSTHNMIGLESQLTPGYPATPAGQRAFLQSVRDITERSGGGRCLGFVYWAPDWVAGGTPGSPWENLALFDFEHRALTAWEVFAPGPGETWSIH